ncbi:MAG: DUF4286 family protein [Capnocytophaga sp.]|nr:DUF4286 family protein [Capnocytophaga sp.]
MYVYNLTFVVNPNIYVSWLNWFENVYIPKVNNIGKIMSVRIFKILNATPDFNFAVHHQTSLPQDLFDFITNEVPDLQKLCTDTFGDSVLTFGTELKELNINKNLSIQ